MHIANPRSEAHQLIFISVVLIFPFIGNLHKCSQSSEPTTPHQSAHHSPSVSSSLAISQPITPHQSIHHSPSVSPSLAISQPITPHQSIHHSPSVSPSLPQSAHHLPSVSPSLAISQRITPLSQSILPHCYSLHTVSDVYLMVCLFLSLLRVLSVLFSFTRSLTSSNSAHDTSTANCQ